MSLQSDGKMSASGKRGIYPPLDVFEDEGKIVSSPSGNPDQFERSPNVFRGELPAEGGMLLYFDDQSYAKKGWPVKEAVKATVGVKRAVVNVVRFISVSPVRYFVALFYFFPNVWKKKIIREALYLFADFGDREFQECWLKPQYYSTVCREIYRVGMIMAEGDTEYVKFVKVVCMTLEYDDAYRYRFQDAMEDFSKERFMENPSEEIRRIISTIHRREISDLKVKLEKLGIFLSFLFKMRIISGPMKEFVRRLDLEKVRMDMRDWYWCLNWPGYDYRGMTLTDRLFIKQGIDAGPSEGREKKEQYLKDKAAMEAKQTMDAVTQINA